MPDTWLAMPMLSAGIGLTSLRIRFRISLGSWIPPCWTRLIIDPSLRLRNRIPPRWTRLVGSSIGLDPLSSVPCSGLKFQVSTHDYEGRYRSASEKTSRQPEEAESDRWLQSQLDSDRTTGPYLELDCTEYNLIWDRSEVPIKKKLLATR
ncbi:hypothetical protein PGT21_036771 [Puccinia graminis f. sp. tritici]|uniref:Uncharacterized protein n=1 Tax=Puccinia graminis f. sp. tritici TaxID=56615 RepID=A0A5B0QQP7_PUCGR|nr:hypothetical protein PGT21_036771 [Puccinia graminis f. sp. tritici]